jgi:hypothetical protein
MVIPTSYDPPDCQIEIYCVYWIVICIITVEYIGKPLSTVMDFERLDNTLIKGLESTCTISWKPTDSNIERRGTKLSSCNMYREVVYC